MLSCFWSSQQNITGWKYTQTWCFCLLRIALISWLCLPTAGSVVKAVIYCHNRNHKVWWHTTTHAPRTLTQNPEAGNYRGCFINQAHPWLLLVNSHTHAWNSWKRTLLVWLCWSAYCNYVAFNCALLTPSRLGWAVTRDLGESPVCWSEAGWDLDGIVCFAIKDVFRFFPFTVTTANDLWEMRNLLEAHQSSVLVKNIKNTCNILIIYQSDMTLWPVTLMWLSDYLLIAAPVTGYKRQEVSLKLMC